MTTQAQARQLLFSLLPPGEVYDLDNPSSDVYKYFNSLAQTVKTYGFDVLDTLESEFNVATATQKLPDWEAALNLTQCPGTGGSLTERRQAIISRLREFGSAGIGSIAPIIAPLFGSYTNVGLVQLIETDRVNFGNRHKHTQPGSFGVGGSVQAHYFFVPDGGYIGPSGVTLFLTVDTAGVPLSAATDMSITITSPHDEEAVFSLNTLLGGNVATPAGVQTARAIAIKTTALKGLARGMWVASYHKPFGAGANVSNVTLFVEGASSTGNTSTFSRLPGLGNGAYEWAVAPFGVSAPIDARCVQMTLDRIKPAHTLASLVNTLSLAEPEDATSIPGRTIPTAATDAPAYSTTVLGNTPTSYWRMSQYDDNGTETNLGSSGAVLTYSGYTAKRTTRGALYRDVNRASIFGLASGNTYGSTAAPYVNGLRVFSLECWVKTTNSNNVVAGDNCPANPIFGNRTTTNASFGISAGTPTYWIQIGGVFSGLTSTTRVDDGKWHHIVWTLNGNASGTLSQYVDGALDASVGVGGTQIDLVTLQDVGSTLSSLASQKYLNGVLDEVAVYSFVLSSADVSAHHAAGRNIA